MMTGFTIVCRILPEFIEEACMVPSIAHFCMYVLIEKLVSIQLVATIYLTVDIQSLWIALKMPRDPDICICTTILSTPSLMIIIITIFIIIITISLRWPDINKMANCIVRKQKVFCADLIFIIQEQN